MEREPKNKNLTKLKDAFSEEIVADLSSRYPEAFVSLLNREPSEIDKILDLQSRAETIISQIAGTDTSKSEGGSVTEIISRLQDTTLQATKEEIDAMPQARAFISFTGQGGAGKDTVMTNFLDKMAGQKLSAAKVVCSTTRDARPGEIDGKDYYFVDDTKVLEMLANVDVTPELISQLATIGVDFKGDKITSELLEEIKNKAASKGVTLFFNETEKSPAPIYLTYNPGRGWYTILDTEVTKATEKSPLSLVIEDPVIVTKVIESSKAKNPDLIGKIICVLPPHPMILHMALRAITRDEVLAKKTEPLSAESLFSTIGERQLDILKDFSRIPKDMLIILVNDKFENGVTVASADLFKAFMGLATDIQ